MRICQPHWKDLKQAIADRGLYKFVAGSGEEVVEKMEAGGFDPLMHANIAITAAAVKDAGPEILVGDKCPLCEVENQTAGLAANWINGAADDELIEARKRGLITSN